MKIIIHHHSLVYQEGTKFWFQSFFGSWVQELSNHFEEVAVLVEMTTAKTEFQDYLVDSSQIRLYSIGYRGAQSKAQRTNSIKNWGKELSGKYDFLLIRGITPRQYEVYRAFTNSKVFLLVGSLIDSKPQFGLSTLKILLWYLNKVRLIQLKLISKGAQMFANSPKIVNELDEILHTRSTFIPTNTISANDFIPIQFRGIQKVPKLLFCGRVVKDKGIEELIEAVSELKKRGLPCALKIVGGILPEYKTQLLQMIDRLEISELISFQGFVSFGNELLNFYREADIYILPSWHEGFPHSIWEASCSCTPVITTDVGGIPGLVSSDEVLFIRPKCALEISQAVFTLIENQSGVELRVENAYKLARSYSVENCARLLKDKLGETVK
ncbi:MAG: glycosyltransferase family 4 protein [Ferruginibacter sp.]|nr:glycosyltransferase family 4 protein [Ferruginibacter sp.]